MDAPIEPPAAPLTHLSQQPVLKYMNIYQRSQLKHWCPEGRDIDQSVPYTLEEFTISAVNNLYKIVVKGKNPRDPTNGNNAVPTNQRHIVWTVTTERITKEWKNWQEQSLERTIHPLVGSQLDFVNACVKNFLGRRETVVKDLDLGELTTVQLKHPIKVRTLKLKQLSSYNKLPFLEMIQSPIPNIDIHGEIHNEHIRRGTIPQAKNIYSLRNYGTIENLHLLNPSDRLYISVRCFSDQQQLPILLKRLVNQSRPHKFPVTIDCRSDPKTAIQSLIDDPESNWKTTRYLNKAGFSLERNGNEVFMRQDGTFIEMCFMTWGFKRSNHISLTSASSVFRFMPLNLRQKVYKKSLRNHPLVRRTPVQITNFNMLCENGRLKSAEIDGEKFLHFEDLSMFRIANVSVQNLHVEGFLTLSCLWKPFAVKNLSIATDWCLTENWFEYFNKEPLDSLTVTSRMTVRYGQRLVKTAKRVIYLDEQAKRKHGRDEEQPPNKKFKAST